MTKEKVRILGREPGHWHMVERVVRKAVNNARYGYIFYDKQKVFVRKVTNPAEQSYIFGGAAWVSINESDMPFYEKGNRVAVTFEDYEVINGTVIEAIKLSHFQSLFIELDEPRRTSFSPRYHFSASDMAIKPL